MAYRISTGGLNAQSTYIFWTSILYFQKTNPYLVPVSITFLMDCLAASLMLPALQAGTSSTVAAGQCPQTLCTLPSILRQIFCYLRTDVTDGIDVTTVNPCWLYLKMKQGFEKCILRITMETSLFCWSRN